MASLCSCAFSKLVGGDCGPSLHNPSDLQCIRIGDCQKSVKDHLKFYKVIDSSLNLESELLLVRAGIFEKNNENYLNLTVCPQHRDKYGLRWRSNRKNCSTPNTWAAHSVTKKGERGITTAQSKQLFVECGTLIPVGTIICTDCRKRLDELIKECGTDGHVNFEAVCTSAMKSSSVEQPADSLCKPGVSFCRTISEHSLSQNLSTPVSSSTEVISTSRNLEDLSIDMTALTLEENTSLFIPSSNSSNAESEEEIVVELSRDAKRHLLNDFLESCHVRKVRSAKKRWTDASEKTKESRTKTASDVIIEVLEIISPDDAALLWEAVQDSSLIEEKLGIAENPADKKYLEALAETFRHATSWDTRRQVLSVMADLVPYKVIQKYIPGISDYRIKAARKHKVVYGRGVPVPSNKSPRVRIDPKKLDNFLTFITSSHVVQDLPFGQKYLTLSTGEVLETPNVIRSMISERIVQQYSQYCEEIGEQPFSRSTMLKILTECSATSRKSLQGIDYIAADGAKGFDSLMQICKQLEECNAVSREQSDNWCRWLLDMKHYIKIDYKVHVTQSSPIADHCIPYSLGDPKEPFFRSGTCEHNHDQYCMECETLKSLLADIKECLNDKNISLTEDTLDDICYRTNQAVQDIEAWKAHQMRSVVQDMARTDALNLLDDTSILITIDWAMKLLPQKYRESQTDWFAKRGISWHICVVARKHEGKVQTQSFVHIIEKCNQESPVVICIIEHVLKTLKSENPEITSAYLRSDNAGCYHSSVLLLACALMEKRTGISVSRFDFSDPQGGKGPCDRKAATIKAHARRWINEGNDIQTAEEFKEAIISAGGVRGVRVVVENGAGLGEKSIKWDGISFLNNFEFTEKGIKVWRAYNIGDGKTVQLEHPDSSKSAFKQQFTPGLFTDVTLRKENAERLPKQSLSPSTESQDNHHGEASDQSLPSIFPCPNDGCVKVYQRYFALERHLFYGRCDLQHERLTVLDQAKVSYHNKLTEGASGRVQLKCTNASELPSSADLPTEGWALKKAKTSARFNENIKKYLDEKFDIGQETGHKMNPATVARDMRFARGPDGSRLFTITEFLSEQQVQSYFSRLAAKRRKQQNTQDQNVTPDDAASQEELEYLETRQKILQELDLTHPICCDNYDLCAIYHTEKLGNMTVALLRYFCEYFHLDVEPITAKRKAPYIALLTELIQTCGCSLEKNAST